MTESSFDRIGGLRRLALAALAVLTVSTVFAGLLVSQAEAAGQPSAEVSKKTSKKKVKVPAGAKKISTKTAGKFTCGKISGEWVPGSKLKGGYFISFAQTATNATKAAKKAKGSKKKALKKQADKARKSALAGANACSSLNPRSPSYVPPSMPPPSGPTGPIVGSKPKFSGLKGSVAAGIADTAVERSKPSRRQGTTPSSNLVAVDANGDAKAALEAGTGFAGSQIKVKQIFTGPSGGLYVAFEYGVFLDAPNYTNGQMPRQCLLAKVDIETGNPTCIYEMGQNGGGWWGGQQGREVQFDNQGGVYYRFNECGPSGCKAEIRRWQEGVGVDKVAGGSNQSVEQYIVIPSTQQVVARTTYSGTPMIRLITRQPDGTYDSEVLMSGWANFMEIFPDGNVYLGLPNGRSQSAWNQRGVARFTAGQSQLDSSNYMGVNDNTAGPNPLGPPTINVSSNADCGGLGSGNWGSFCSSGGADLSGAWWDPQGRIFQQSSSGALWATSGYGTDKRVLRYFAPGVPTANVFKVLNMNGDLDIKQMAVVGEDVYAAGLVAPAYTRTRLVRWNHSTGAYSVVPGFATTDRMEIGALTAVGTRLYYSALRGTDSATVTGYIETAGGTLTNNVTNSQGTRLSSMVPLG